MTGPSENAVFDYVIVGAGSAGCVLANRLSADPSRTVCLIEAGPRDSNPWIHIPVGVPFVIADDRLDWKFWTASQRSLADRRVFVPRGKTLGGSSAINAMTASRGHPADYDDWAAAGATGWSYADVLPYFRRSEAFENYDKLGEDRIRHAANGPLPVSRPLYVHPLVTAFLAAAKEAGLPANSDFAGRTTEGVGLYRVFQRHGRRVSNADAYLHPAERRANLQVLTGVMAERVLFEGPRAQGVVVRRQGQPPRRIVARAEVILSAGAVGSPQLLMLSGIGPGDHLRAMDIGVVADSPQVGANLQDHYDVHLSHLENGRSAVSQRPDAWLKLAVSLGRYLVFRDGDLSISVAQAGAFLKSRPDIERPDIQWHFTPLLMGGDILDSHLVRQHYGFTLVCGALRPQSRGTIRLASPRAGDEPVIDPNYLDHPEDLDAIVAGLQIARRVFEQPAIAAHSEREFEPGADAASAEALATHARAKGVSTYHLVGACRMGCDAQAPLTPDLKVRGVDGLRVVDASVMPLIVGGHTNAPTTMIAERAADLILGRAPTR